MRLTKIGIVIALTLVICSCARYATLGGGTADKAKPINKTCVPQNQATEFNAKKIVLSFDEYIVLKNFNEEFIVSPPLSEKPEKILKGKSVVMKLNPDSLRSNTTYTLNFGNSIVDFREGNVLENYEYVFSTGKHIDSLNLSGYLYLAEDLKPQEKVYVMLYQNHHDSILNKSKPDFIAKTNEQGYFNINNIAAGQYAVFALNDINSNYIFDLPNEQIAFLDSLVILETAPLDTLEKSSNNSINKLSNDSISQPTDSLKRKNYKVIPENINLFLFEEHQENLFLSEHKRLNPYQVQLLYSQEKKTIPNIQINKQSKGFIIESNSRKDSLNIWLTDSNLYNSKTLTLLLDHYITNDLGQLEKKLDTLSINQMSENVSSTPTNSKIKNNTLIINTTLKSRLEVYKPISLLSSFPVKSIDTSKIHLYELEDKDFKDVNFTLSQDSSELRKYLINHPIKEGSKYKLEVEPNGFVDYRGFTNDTIEVTARSKNLDEYCDIIIQTKGISDNPFLIQVLDKSDKIIQSQVVNSNSTVHFKYLKAGTYKTKAIEDKNHNGKWDTGNYKRKIQPERVQFYNQAIELKSGWSREVDWDLAE